MADRRSGANSPCRAGGSGAGVLGKVINRHEGLSEGTKAELVVNLKIGKARPLQVQ
jgi:hypothetical protein